MATLILKETHRILIEKIEALNKEKRETSLRIREAADQGDLKEKMGQMAPKTKLLFI